LRISECGLRIDEFTSFSWWGGVEWETTASAEHIWFGLKPPEILLARHPLAEANGNSSTAAATDQLPDAVTAPIIRNPKSAFRNLKAPRLSFEKRGARVP
jgi:hypothetical protein